MSGSLCKRSSVFPVDEGVVAQVLDGLLDLLSRVPVDVEFGGLVGADLLAGVSSWVGVNIDYVAGSSRPIDGAVETLLGREIVDESDIVEDMQELARDKYRERLRDDKIKSTSLPNSAKDP